MKEVFISKDIRPQINLPNITQPYGTFSSKEGGSDGKEGGSDGQEGGNNFFRKEEKNKNFNSISLKELII